MILILSRLTKIAILTLLVAQPLSAMGQSQDLDQLLNRASKVSRQNPQLALKILDQAPEKKALDDDNYLLLRGRLLMNLNRYQDAQHIYDLYVARHRNEHTAYSRRALSYMLDNLTAKAIADFSHSIELKPVFIDYFNRASCRVHIAKYDEAIADYTSALKLKPNFNMAKFQRGRTYYLIGDYSKAAKDFSDCIKATPQADVLYKARGKAYEALGEAEKAISDYKQAMFCDQGLAESHYTMAFDQEQKNGNGTNPVSALAKMDQYLDSGALKMKKGDLSGALKDFTSASTTNSADIAPFCMAGEAYIMLKKYDDAVKSFTIAWSRSNICRWALAGRARAYLLKQDYQRALSDIGKIIWQDPDIPEPHFQKALALQKLHETTLAKAAFAKYVQVAKKYQNNTSKKSGSATSPTSPDKAGAEMESMKIFSGLNADHLKTLVSR